MIQLHEDLIARIDFATESPALVEAVFTSLSHFEGESKFWAIHKIDALLKKIPLRKLRKYQNSILQFYLNVSLKDRVKRWRSKFGTSAEE